MQHSPLFLSHSFFVVASNRSDIKIPLLYCVLWQVHVLLLISIPFVLGADNTQLVQTNVNLQNVEQNNLEKSQPDLESPTSSAVIGAAVQQEVVAVNQDAVPASAQIKPNVVASLTPQSQPQPAVDPNNVQLLKEANAQYQYQINSRYEEKTRPVYSNDISSVNSQYPLPPPNGYQYSSGPGYPVYNENSQYQELGNGQQRADTTIMFNDGVKTQYENQDHSSYVHQRSQSFSEYGKGEVSPDYNTYAYKRTYY